MIDDLKSTPLAESQKLPLCFVRNLGHESYTITVDDLQVLHEAGWWNAVTMGALSNFCNPLLSSTGVHPIFIESHNRHASKRVRRGCVC